MRDAEVFTKKIFKYDNYRAFLCDYFEFSQKNQKSFSKRYFAQKIGFASHSFLIYILRGEKNLSESSLLKVSQALGLNNQEAEYFDVLVRFNQAATADERDYYYKKMNSLRAGVKFFHLSGGSHFIYFHEWYYPVVREVAALKKSVDPKKIAAAIVPRITPSQAKKALSSLIEAGLLQIDENGVPSVENPCLSADNIPPFVFNKLKKDYIYRSIEALDTFKADKRHISYSTITVSENQYKRLTKMLDDLRNESVIMSNNIDENENVKVMQLNFQLYPLTGDVSLKK